MKITLEKTLLGSFCSALVVGFVVAVVSNMACTSPIPTYSACVDRGTKSLIAECVVKPLNNTPTCTSTLSKPLASACDVGCPSGSDCEFRDCQTDFECQKYTLSDPKYAALGPFVCTREDSSIFGVCEVDADADAKLCTTTVLGRWDIGRNVLSIGFVGRKDNADDTIRAQVLTRAIADETSFLNAQATKNNLLLRSCVVSTDQEYTRAISYLTKRNVSTFVASDASLVTKIQVAVRTLNTNATPAIFLASSDVQVNAAGVKVDDEDTSTKGVIRLIPSVLQQTDAVMKKALGGGDAPRKITSLVQSDSNEELVLQASVVNSKASALAFVTFREEVIATQADVAARIGAIVTAQPDRLVIVASAAQTVALIKQLRIQFTSASKSLPALFVVTDVSSLASSESAALEGVFGASPLTTTDILQTVQTKLGLSSLSMNVGVLFDIPFMIELSARQTASLSPYRTPSQPNGSFNFTSANGVFGNFGRIADMTDVSFTPTVKFDGVGNNITTDPSSFANCWSGAAGTILYSVGTRVPLLNTWVIKSGALAEQQPTIESCGEKKF